MIQTILMVILLMSQHIKLPYKLMSGFYFQYFMESGVKYNESMPNHLDGEA